MPPKTPYPPLSYYALIVLCAVNTMNFFDRQLLGAVGEPLRREWGLSDGALGWLGTAFTLLYAAFGVPLGRLADRRPRKYILAAGVFFWSVLTAAQGLAQRPWHLFTLRLGVGLGEASCAPAASSLIGDLFPAGKRATALSIFMAGLPLGVALSYFLGGRIADRYGWQSAFFVAAIPGLLCAAGALLLPEPERGAVEAHAVGGLKRQGSPYRLVLSTPTMWWLIASGALHNFNMYALGTFLLSFLIRSHGLEVSQAGDIAGIVSGLSGFLGLFAGGLVGDAIVKRRPNGRLLASSLALLASVPLVYLGLGRPRGDLAGFTLLMGLGSACMYVYYSTVYSTIQDVIEPSLRGTAMALYFFAMYALGASFGPAGTGWLSDHFTRRAAGAAGVTDMTQSALEPFRAEGLHSAMYIIPLLGLLLAFVLFAGSLTVRNDTERLRRWMREAAPGAQSYS